MAQRRLVVFTVSTRRDVGTSNLETLLTHFGYDFEVLGRGEHWGGWTWRTAQYIAALQRIVADDAARAALPTQGQSPRDLLAYARGTAVILCDASDMLVLQPPDVALRTIDGLLHASGVRVVVGAEPCCHKPPYHFGAAREAAMAQRRAEVPYTLLRYPNGGFIAGDAYAVLRLLHSNADAKDDQAGLLGMLLEHRAPFVLDHEQRLVANVIPALRPHSRDPDPQLLAHVAGLGDLDGAPWIVSTKQGAGLPQRAVGSAPVPPFWHFPAKNWSDYNRVLRSAFGPLPPTSLMSALDAAPASLTVPSL